MSKLTKRLAMGRRLATIAMPVLLGACVAAESATEPELEEISAVTVSPAAAGVTVGGTVRLTVDVRNQNGERMTGEAVTWTSSDTAIAVVSDEGVVATLRAGEVEVRARARGRSGRSTITATTPSVTSVRITPTPVNLTVGSQVQLAATTFTVGDSVLTGRAISWTTSDPTIATVNSSGLVTSVALGAAIISATSENQVGTASVGVVASAVGAVTTLSTVSATENSVTLRFTEVSDGQGGAASYAVRYATPTISWGSATTVAEGSCQTPMAGTSVGAVRSCTVQGLSAGTAYQFQVAAFRGEYGSGAVYGALSNVVSRTTSAASVASVTMTPASASSAVGTPVTFAATLRDAAGNVLTGRTITWTSTTPAVASVSSSGVATPLTVGGTTIRATSGGVSGNATLTVTAATAPAPVASIAVTSGQSSITTGQSAQFTATLRDSAGNVLTGRTVTWSSTNTGIATVNGSGLASGVGVGSASIRATSGTVNGEAPLTVTTPPPAGATVFSSDWSNSTGATSQAVTDGGRWPILACSSFGNVLSVVAGSSVGFLQSPNVLRVQMRGGSSCGMLQRDDVVPISTTHWGRFFVRNDENGSRNGHASAYHNVHAGAEIQAVPWSRDATGLGNGYWRMTIGGTDSYPFDRWDGPRLQNGVWYRYEWQMRYFGATDYRVFPRIYDVAGNLLYDEDDFVEHDGTAGSSTTLAQYYAMNSGTRMMRLAAGSGASAELARNFGIGNEGPGAAPDTRGYWYYAKFALSTTGWIGQ